MRRTTLPSATLLACALALAACQPGAQADAAAAPEPADPAAAAPSPAAAAVESAATRLNPLASAKDEVMAAGKRMLAARTYHATITTDNDAQDFRMEIDFVAPDRFRVEMPMGTQVIIGDTMHMTMQGRTMTVPVPAGTTDMWRDPNKLEANTDGMQAESLGSDAVDGATATKYRITHADPALQPSLLWIGGDGYPLRVEADGELQGRPSKTVVTYSRFNDASIVVEAPR